MTKFWKVVVLSLVVGVGLSLGGSVYAVRIWPANLKAQVEANARADVRIEQERERLAQENERLAHQKEMLRLEAEKLDLQLKLVEAQTKLGEQFAEFAVQLKRTQDWWDAERRRQELKRNGS